MRHYYACDIKYHKLCRCRSPSTDIKLEQYLEFAQKNIKMALMACNYNIYGLVQDSRSRRDPHNEWGEPTTQGASKVKWTALDPCLGLSESDPKLYTNFEFYEIEIHKHLENI